MLRLASGGSAFLLPVFIKPELSVSKAWGPLTLELTPSVTFYTDNDDFLNGMTREQDPLYAVQGHVIYSFTRGIWVSIDTTYYLGGTTQVDGIENDDRQENWRVGATFSMPSTWVSTRTGIDFDALGIAFQYRWGEGL